jgi:hypothetical protein
MAEKLKYYVFILSFCWLSFHFLATKQYDFKAFNLDPCYMENESFQAGEELVYKIFYNLGFIWLPAGEVAFELRENEDSYFVKVLGRTYKNYEKIYKINDHYYSEFDKESLLPKVFVRNVHEGKYRRYDSILFDHKQLVAKSFWGNTRAKAKWYEFELNSCMQDMLTTLYYVRNIPLGKLEKGSQFPVNVFFDKEAYPLNVSFKGVEKRKKIKDLGVYNTVRIEPDVVAGHVFKNNSKMKIWISNDLNKIPLLIESPVSVGSVKAVLKSHKGLKYPLKSN